MPQKLFDKEELRKRVYELKDGVTTNGNFCYTFVEELLEEMFPDSKNMYIVPEIENKDDWNRKDNFILQVFE